MLHALATLVTAAVEQEESPKTLFYVLGSLAAVYAVAVAAIGITQPDFPRTSGTARAVFAVSTVVVVLAMASAVITG